MSSENLANLVKQAVASSNADPPGKTGDQEVGS